MGYTQRSSRVLVDEWTKGGTVDLRLRNCEAGPNGTVDTNGVGTQIINPDRKPRQRPRKEAAAPSATVIPPPVPVPAMPSPKPSLTPTTPTTPTVKDDEEESYPIITDLPETLNNFKIEVPSTPKSQPEPALGQETIPDQSAGSKPPPNPEPPRSEHFTRSKRKREADPDADAEEERMSKILKALVAKIKKGESIDSVIERAYVAFESAYPAKVFNGIRIPQTYEEAIRESTLPTGKRPSLRKSLH